jgi:hypothetical protein
MGLSVAASSVYRQNLIQLGKFSAVPNPTKHYEKV